MDKSGSYLCLAFLALLVPPRRLSHSEESDSMALRNGRLLKMMICIVHIAMLRWHSFVPALAVSSLLLMLLEHQRVRRITQLLDSANNDQATACRRSLTLYLALVDVSFVAASLSILPDRHTLPDMILSALRECCMLFGILIYMSMPLSKALGVAKDDQDDSRDLRLVAIFPALLAMLVFPLVWHDATFASFAGGSLHLYLFGLCKVAMILSYQWFQSTFAHDDRSDHSHHNASGWTGWRSEHAVKAVPKTSKALRFAKTKQSLKDDHRLRPLPRAVDLREAPPAWLIGCIDCEFDFDEMDLV
eukprot:s922_g9.t1